MISLLCCRKERQARVTCSLDVDASLCCHPQIVYLLVSNMRAPEPQPFTIDVSSDTLDWITQRVQTARIIPDVKQPEGREWADGIPSSAITELVDYWKSSYDWRKVEAKLNSTFKMYTLDIKEGTETINLHFVHHRSERPGAIPLLFAHGWPGNFTEVPT